jgi:hypothetical protein
MTINLDSEIVATAFDPATQTCAYTIARDGKRWTVRVPLVHLDAHGASKDARRAHLANVLMAAMRDAPDDAGPTENVCADAVA